MNYYLTNINSVEPDKSLNKERGFTGVGLRWLLSEQNVPGITCTVGYTHKKKGGEHRLHRHMDADEVILMLRGTALQKIGDENVDLNKGDCVYIPKGIIHSHTCISDEVETYCIYIGAASLEKTGYVLDEK